MSFFKTLEEKERWIEHRTTTQNKDRNSGIPTPHARQAEAIRLYKKYHGFKSPVCNELHMARETLNKILKNAGVA